MSYATIADSLSPEILAELAQSYGLDIDALDYCDGAFIEDEYLEALMGFVTGEHLWDTAWRFGIVLDDDAARVSSLGNYWRPEGTIETGYYVPNDYDTEISLISLDNPPKLLSIAEQGA